MLTCQQARRSGIPSGASWRGVSCQQDRGKTRTSNLSVPSLPVQVHLRLHHQRVHARYAQEFRHVVRSRSSPPTPVFCRGCGNGCAPRRWHRKPPQFLRDTPVHANRHSRKVDSRVLSRDSTHPPPTTPALCVPSLSTRQQSRGADPIPSHRGEQRSAAPVDRGSPGSVRRTYRDRRPVFAN